MYFTKVPHPANFAYPERYDPKTGVLRVGGRRLQAKLQAYERGVHRLRIEDADLWEDGLALCQLTPPPATENGNVRVTKGFEIEVLGQNGEPILRSRLGLGFGLMGVASIFVFERPEGARFFGMGEKTFGRLELSGIRTKFWNTDVWADFHWKQWGSHPSDPYYLSIPYVVVECDGEYVGLLYENACAPFIETGAATTIPTEHVEPQDLLIGAEDGLPTLWIITGPTLADVTSKLAKLVGTTPLPPLWALGYHQSRWGYGGEKDLVELDAAFDEHDIPCDGLWLDIDYMEGYRVFTYSKKGFPKGPEKAVKKVAPRRVVPILDPGVKLEPGYPVYDHGRKQRVFCQNPQGQEFVGMVWPGRTVFPDFTTEKGRKWWSGYAKDFRAKGFAGAWLDMNDPATGGVDPLAMLFRDGRYPHRFFHNQYALGMQMATRDGFLAAEPDRRPFLLTRSGWIGTSRFSAVWTGDNVSNRFYLKGCIPTTLNLALSGIPFNGPDVGGFGDDTTEDLMLDWVKCCFLFPFMRNHSVFGSRLQEPWRFSRRATKVIGHFIRTRYRLLPYLYNLFIEQEEEGHPAIRPLLYHFVDPKAISDQFLVGESLLQAPFLDGEASRTVVLPGRRRWFSLETGEWLKPGRVRAVADLVATPLFVRDGSIVPAFADGGERSLAKVEFHVFVDRTDARTVYRFDDGETYGYRRGERSTVEVLAKRRRDRLEIEIRSLTQGFGPLEYSVVIHGEPGAVLLNGQKVGVQRTTVDWAGCRVRAYRLLPAQ